MSCASKTCCKCNIDYPLNNYRKYNENSFSNTCKGCFNELDKARKKQRRENRLNNTFVKCEKSKRVCFSFTREPFWLTCLPRTFLSAAWSSEKKIVTYSPRRLFHFSRSNS